jgi:signal transduction histidine kinase
VRDAVERLQAAGAKQPIQLRAAPGPVWVDADPERLAQVLDNLLGNAAKYSPADEPIAVEVEAIRDAQVIVRDCGPGIAPDELPHLFERFYRTHGARRGQQKGSGLGLYISHEIARAHGGDLTADSALGAGSCFTLHLPLAGAPDAAPLSPGLS